MTKILQLNPIQTMSFFKIIGEQSVYAQILEQLKKEQKEVLTMCQSHNDYQLMKQEIKKRISKRSLQIFLIFRITSLAIVSAVKTILTQTKHSLMNFEGLFEQKNTDNKRISSQNMQNTLFTQTQNPYSHILCFRLLKYAITKGDYGLVSLIAADLSELIFNIATFENTNQNLQRGRNIYLQNYNLQSNAKSLPMSFDEMEHIGYSVHTFALESMFVLGNELKFLPYHSNFIKQKQVKSSIQKKSNQNKDLSGQYPSELLQSKCHKLYIKTQELNVQYGERLHYFKNQEIQKLHRKNFNSEENHHQITEFYQFLFALTIQRQIHLNEKLLKAINQFNQGQFGNFYRRYLKKPFVNGFLLTLKQILNTNDRHCLYFITICLIKTLSSIEKFQNQKVETTFYSLCQILDELMMKIRLKEDETQKEGFLQLKCFNFEIYQSLDQVIGHNLFQVYDKVFCSSKVSNQNDQKPTYFHQYAKHYFHYFLLRVKKVKDTVASSIKKSHKWEFSSAMQPENSFFQQKRTILQNFGKEKEFGIKNMNTSFSDYRLLRRFDCLKNNFSIPLEFIQSQKLKIHKDAFKFFRDQQKLLTHDSIILKQAKVQIQQFSKNNEADTPSFKNKYKDVNQSNFVQSTLQETYPGKNSLQMEQIDDIPKQAVNIKTVALYQLRKNTNDISKINLKSTKTTRTTKLTERTEFTQKESSSIKDTLRQGTIKMNLAERDIQALRNLSKNKYKRKQSNSRMNSQARGFETVLEPLSSPTFGEQIQIDDFSEQLNATYKDALSERTFNKKSNQEKVDYFVTPYQELKSGQIKAIIDMMRVKNGSPSKQKQRTFTFQPSPQPVHAVHLATPYPSNDLFSGGIQLHVKDSISKQMHQINVDDKSTGRFQKQKTQNITDLFKNNSLSPLDSFLGAFLPKNNINIKSNLQNRNEQQVTSFKLIQRASSNHSLEQPSSPTFRITKKLIDQSSKNYQNNHLETFFFQLKMKRQILKKKVLLIKDEMIEIGMITEIQIPVKQIPFLNQKLQNNKNVNLHPKLKATLYITSLAKQVNKIQIDIACPSWISHHILENKVKQIAQANSQYVSTIQFSLQNLLQPKSDKQKLPRLQFDMKKKGNPHSTKHYELQLPLFLNKFFSQSVINDDEVKRINNRLKQLNILWLDLSSKLIKEFCQLGKYFPKLKYGGQQVSMAKISFLQETMYLCFRNNKRVANNPSSDSPKNTIKSVSFLILHQNEITEKDTIINSSSKKSSQTYDLMLSTFRSLLGE